MFQFPLLVDIIKHNVDRMTGVPDFLLAGHDLQMTRPFVVLKQSQFQKALRLVHVRCRQLELEFGAEFGHDGKARQHLFRMDPAQFEIARNDLGLACRRWRRRGEHKEPQPTQDGPSHWLSLSLERHVGNSTMRRELSTMTSVGFSRAADPSPFFEIFQGSVQTLRDKQGRTGSPYLKNGHNNIYLLAIFAVKTLNPVSGNM